MKKTKYRNYMRLRFGYVLFATVILFAGCGEKKERKEKTPVSVKVEKLAEGDSFGETYVGIVEEDEATAVSFTSMGVIKRLHVHEGQTVRRGQLLAEMDATTMSNTVEATQASTSQAQDMVEQAQSTYAQAKDAYDRMKLLHDNGSLPEIKWIEAETRLRQAETALRTAKTGVRSANAMEKIARKNLSDTKLYAPVGGVIGKQILGAGETALPSQAVVTILNINNVKVKVAIPEAEMGAVHPNTSSVIDVEAIGRRFNGGHIEKGVQADALTHTYDIRINVANPNHQLLPGMVANVRLGVLPKSSDSHPLRESDKTLSKSLPLQTADSPRVQMTLPVTSVQRKADGSLFVWTVDKNNTAHRRTVSIGHPTGNRVPVTGGLKIDDIIVTEGYQKLSEGTKVRF